MVGVLKTIITEVSFLATELLCLIKLLWHVCGRTVHLILLPWLKLFKFFFGLYLSIGRGMITWALTAISAPLRLLRASRREKFLETQLYELQTQLEEIVRLNRDMDKRLVIVIKEHRHIENLLIEAEEEQDRAMEKIHYLETRVQDVESENFKLKEMNRALLMAEEQFANGVKKVDSQHVSGKWTVLGKKYCGISEPHKTGWDYNLERRGKARTDNLMDKEGKYHDSGNKNKQPNSFLESRVKSFGYFSSASDTCSKKSTVDDEVLYQWRGVALAQSIFSACLSLLVGMIAWEAQDPCMPLVLALFTVVGMSLKSVVKIFSTLENRPGSDAVALLSFNWFILGALASPTLPNVLRLVAPLASEFGYLLADWLGLTLS
eukprot:Gb_02168 [translate_table: standard]